MRETFLEQIISAGREFKEFAKLWPLLMTDESTEKLISLKKDAEPHVVKRIERLLTSPIRKQPHRKLYPQPHQQE